MRLQPGGSLDLMRLQPGRSLDLMRLQPGRSLDLMRLQPCMRPQHCMPPQVHALEPPPAASLPMLGDGLALLAAVCQRHRRRQAATPCTAGCNPMRRRLQPPCSTGCDLTCQVCNAIYLTGAKRLVGVLPLPLFFTMVFWIGSLGLGLALLLLTDAELSRDINQGLFGWTQPNRTRLPLQAA